MQLEQILNAAVAAVAVSDVHNKNIDFDSTALLCPSNTKIDNSAKDKPKVIPSLLSIKSIENLTERTEKVLSESREDESDYIKSSDNLLNLVKQCSVPLVHVKSAAHASHEHSTKLANPSLHCGSAFKPYNKSESLVNLDKNSNSSYKSLKMAGERMSSSKVSKITSDTANNLEDPDKSVLNNIKISSNLPWESSSYIKNYVNFLKSDKASSGSPNAAEISLHKFINERYTPSDDLNKEIKLGSEIEVSSEMEIDSGIEMSDIEPSSELSLKKEVALESDTSNDMETDRARLAIDAAENSSDDDQDVAENSSDDYNLRLEIDSEMEVKNVMEVAADNSSEVNFLLCQYNDLSDESTVTSSKADSNQSVENEQILDMPILTLDSFEDGEEITTTETQGSLADRLQIEDVVSNYSEFQNSTENAPNISQIDLPEINSKNKISMPPPLLRFEEEVMEQPPDPVEISFFSLDDENLVITSEQALNMFENHSTDTRSHYHGNNVYNNRPSDNYDSKNTYLTSSSACEVNANDLSDISKLLNIEDKTAVSNMSDMDGNILNGFSQQYDYMNAPPFSNIEEIVTMDSSHDSSVDSSSVPRASSEVEILTSDANEPQYTDLTPASAKTVTETSSAVSEALQTLVGNIDFDSPSGSIDSHFDRLSGTTTVGTTVDANGQFVVQVMGSGINMSIPNQYFNQMQENADPNGVLETISEMDIMDILNIDYKNENVTYQPTIENEEEVISSNPLSEDYNHPNSSTDVESKSPRENHPRTDVQVKRKQKDCEPKKNTLRPCSPKKKKCHSSVIAALRESIFRSKARKIVNQLGKDTEILDDLASEDNINDGLMDLNQNYPDKDIGNMVDDIADFDRPHNSSYGNNYTPMEDQPYDYESEPKGYRSHHHYGHYSEDRDYNHCPSPNSEHCSTTADDTRHHYRKHHHKYERSYKPYTKSYPKSRCQGKCCSNRTSYSARDMYYKRRMSHSPPLSARSMRTPYMASGSSCCSKCKHDSSCSSESNNVPVMMLRPEELTSMMKKADGKDGPMVVMPSETINNTDGDPLKVQLVYLVYPMDGQRMSADTLCHSFQKNTRDLSKSPSCGVSCSSNYHEQYPSPHSSSSNLHQTSPPNFRNKEGSWADPEAPASRHSRGTPPHHKPLRQPSQHCYPEDRAEDPQGYLRKPIDTWTYADVVFFLMEACKEIRIDPNEVQFKSTDNGSALLQMSPGDFEVLAANNGQKLYDYFIKFKTQHYMISGDCNPPFSSYGERYPPPHPEPYSPCEDHQNNLPPPGFPDHYHGYPEYHNHRESPYGSPSSYHHPPESPSQEYVPQGAQYTNVHDQHHAFHSPDDRNGRFHDAPSAAGKTFPPLHNFDDSISDPDDSEDEKPPEPPKKRGPGRPPKPENERKRKAKKTGRLWEFIRNLLLDPKTCPSLVRWEDHTEGVFRIVQSDVIANKWGMRKNNEKMNYEKLSRAMRYYYKAKIFEPVLGKRLVYKFGSNAKGWRPLNPNNPNFQNAY